MIQAGDAQAATRGLETTELILVPLEEIVVDDEFNIRVKDDEYKKHVEYLKQLIIANGYSGHAPVTGRVIKINGADVIQLTGGFQRLEAARLAQTEGHPIDTIPVSLHPPDTSEEDLVVALVTDNDGRPLRPPERAEACQRLRDLGMSDKQIAERLHITTGYISMLFSYRRLPEPLQQKVANGTIPAQWAVQKSRQIGPEATLELAEQVKTADASQPRRRRQSPLPGEITRVQAITAIHYAVERQDIDWLTRFERGDDEPMARVKRIIRDSRKKYDL